MLLTKEVTFWARCVCDICETSVILHRLIPLLDILQPQQIVSRNKKNNALDTVYQKILSKAIQRVNKTNFEVH